MTAAPLPRQNAVASECAPAARPGTRPGTRPRAARGYAAGKADYVIRLRKIEGQVRGLQKMIGKDTWCPDVVTQIGSVTRALQEVAVGLLADHLRHCVVGAVRASDADGERAAEELTGTIRQIIRL